MTQVYLCLLSGLQKKQQTKYVERRSENQSVSQVLENATPPSAGPAWRLRE